MNCKEHPMEPIRSYKLTVLLVLFSSILAHASSARTYVSVNGNDSNTGIGCPVTAPCRSFGAALGVTNPFGEIVAVDNGDYAPVMVTQSVTIQAAPGVDATVVSPFSDAIRVTVGTNDIVILRGLNVNGLNTAPSGIRFTAGGTLNIENCSITSFNMNGISIEAGGSVHIKDSEVENTGTAIRLQSSSGLIHASIDGVHLKHNMNVGLFAALNSQATLRKSVLADNRNNGISAGDFAGTSEVNVEDCLIQGSNTGIFAANGGGGGTALVRVSHSSIVDNSTGLSSLGAPLLSYGDNRLAGNGVNGSFTGLIALQ
jgi:Right handed beta helix region